MKEYKFFDNLSNLYGEQKYLSQSAPVISIYRVEAPNLTFTCELPAKMPETFCIWGTKRETNYDKLSIINSQLVFTRLQMKGLVYARRV